MSLLHVLCHIKKKQQRGGQNFLARVAVRTSAPSGTCAALGALILIASVPGRRLGCLRTCAVHALVVSLSWLAPFLAVTPPPAVAGLCTHGGVLETVVKNPYPFVSISFQ
jgi:hypothetical protein